MGQGTPFEMVSRDAELRIARARELAARFPYAAEALLFYCHLAPFSGGETDLRAIVTEYGPPALRDAALTGGEPFNSFRDFMLGEHVCSEVLIANGAEYGAFCGFCARFRTVPRAQCIYCQSSDVAFFSSESLPHIRAQVCEQCRRYVSEVDVASDASAVADLDEIAALPLDLWVRQSGYTKATRNWMGL